MNDDVVLRADIIFTGEELARFDTPDKLRELLDAKLLSMRGATTQALRDLCGRETAAKPSPWGHA